MFQYTRDIQAANYAKRITISLNEISQNPRCEDRLLGFCLLVNGPEALIFPLFGSRGDVRQNVAMAGDASVGQMKELVEFSEIGHKQDVICKPDDIR